MRVWRSIRWLVARRLTQAGCLALFLGGAIKGSLSSSLVLGTLPLSDPFIALQTLFAGHRPAASLLVGAAIVAAFYAVIGGRVYCAWVCPVNLVTDAAAALRARWKPGEGMRFSRHLRLWGVAAVLAAAALTGTVAWEAVNPVTLLYRGLLFGGLGGAAAAIVPGVFLLDWAGGARLWCGQLCPVGAFYGLLGRFSLLRVRAEYRQRCDDCLACFRSCPEPHLLAPALRGESGPVIVSGDCTNCGRCLDVCDREVFTFGPRWRGAPSRPPQSGECAL